MTLIGLIKPSKIEPREMEIICCTAAKSLQLCLTLCNPIDGSPPGSPVPGILQARTLEWVASSFSNAWKWKVKVKTLSHVQLVATPWTTAYQAPPSMGLSRQGYWSVVPLPSPGNYMGKTYCVSFSKSECGVGGLAVPLCRAQVLLGRGCPTQESELSLGGALWPLPPPECEHMRRESLPGWNGRKVTCHPDPLSSPTCQMEILGPQEMVEFPDEWCLCP